MPTIGQLTSEELRKPEIMKEINSQAREYVAHEQMARAWNLASKLELQTKILMDAAPELHKDYQKIINQLKFAALPFLTEEQIFELLETHFLAALESETDIKAKIRAYLMSRSIFAWDQFRRDIIARLKRNQQTIGNKTISEWLLNYDKAAGARKNTSIERSKFMGQDPEVKRLSEESKSHVSALLKLYDDMKISVPLPIIGISETSLKEYFKEFGIPLPEEEEKKGKIPLPKKLPAKTEEILKRIEAARISKKEELEKETVAPEAKISPYEKKRELIPEKKKEETKIKGDYQIRTMKRDIEKTKEQPMPTPPTGRQAMPTGRQALPTGRQAIPPKPKPKIKDNIVDLSGK